MISIRSAKEIGYIRESCQIVAEVLREIKGYVYDDISTEEIDHFIENFIRRRRALPAFKGYHGFPAASCISINEEVVHGIPGKRKLKKGDVVSIDIGVLKNGYYGDSALTLVVESSTSKNMNLVRTTEKALEFGIREARSGNHISDISAAIQKFVESQRCSVVRDLVGHGIGTQLHEEPQIPNYGKPGQGALIENGMVLAIEPMVNAGSYHVKTLADGWTVCTVDQEASAHFEHTVAIVNNEPHILTQSV